MHWHAQGPGVPAALVCDCSLLFAAVTVNAVVAMQAHLVSNGMQSEPDLGSSMAALDLNKNKHKQEGSIRQRAVLVR